MRREKRRYLLDHIREGSELGDQIVAVRPLEREVVVEVRMGGCIAERFDLGNLCRQDREVGALANTTLNKADAVSRKYLAARDMHLVEVGAMRPPHLRTTYEPGSEHHPV